VPRRSRPAGPPPPALGTRARGPFPRRAPRTGHRSVPGARTDADHLAQSRL